MLLCKKWFLPVVILLLSGCASRVVEQVAEATADSFVGSSPTIRVLKHRMDVLEGLTLGNSADIRTLRNNVHHANDVASERIDDIEKYIKRLKFKAPKSKDLFSL